MPPKPGFLRAALLGLLICSPTLADPPRASVGACGDPESAWDGLRRPGSIADIRHIVDTTVTHVQWIRAQDEDSGRLSLTLVPRSRIREVCPRCITYDHVRYFSSIWDVASFLPRVCAPDGEDLGAPREFGSITAESCRHIAEESLPVMRRSLRTEVTERRAANLFEFMRLQREAALRIPFDYPEDGCYARAHYMTHLLEQLGFESRKVFIFNTEGGLHVSSRWAPGGRVDWRYHVAPVLRVRLADGRVEDRVLDPSMADRPIPFETWREMMGQDSCRRVGSSDVPETSGCVFTETPRSTYAPAWGGSGRILWSADDSLQSTQATMAAYMRVVLARSGRTP